MKTVELRITDCASLEAELRRNLSKVFTGIAVCTCPHSRFKALEEGKENGHRETVVAKDAEWQAKLDASRNQVF